MDDSPLGRMAVSVLATLGLAVGALIAVTIWPHSGALILVGAAAVFLVVSILVWRADQG